MLDIRKVADLETLRQVCFAYEKSNALLVERIRQLAQRLAEAEGLDAAQIGLDLPDIHQLQEAEAPASPSANPDCEVTLEPRTSRPGHGPTPQPRLPIEQCLHVFDSAPECSVCGRQAEAWEGQHEESEEITVVETSFRIAVHLRQKYRCSCGGPIVTAPGPPKLIPGGRYSVEFAVHAAIAKYCDHIPLERQVRQATRAGLEVTSQTLWDQLDALAGHLEPTWEAIREEILGQPVLHADETGWKMMGSKTNPKWTAWGLTSPDLAYYHLVGSKSAATAEKLFKGFRGTLVVDGYAVYPLLARSRNLRIAHCWAHADRKFKECKDPPAAVAEIRGLIAKLYEIEREAFGGSFPGDAATQAVRLRLRKERSAPLLQQIRDWAFAQGGLRRSPFGKAVRYLLKHWEGLTLFLEDPRIPLDNNAAERALRGVVVGRKNYFGNRSKRGAKVAAILYTLIETAKLRGIEPSRYLRKATAAAIESPGRVTLP